MIGSPSFTSSLIIIPMIPLSVISGFFGGVLGYAIEAIIKLIKKRNVLQKKETLITALLLSIIVFGLAIFVPLKLQLVWKAHNSPHIIVDTGFIKKISYNSNSNIQNINGLSQCIINFEQRYAGKQLFWNGKAFRVVFDEHQFSVLDETGKTFITQPLEGFDYIRELSCFPFDTGLSLEPPLVIFADLRATSGNSIINFYNSNGECLYQELTENVNSIYLGKKHLTGETFVIIKTLKSGKFLYKINKTQTKSLADRVEE